MYQALFKISAHVNSFCPHNSMELVLLLLSFHRWKYPTLTWPRAQRQQKNTETWTYRTPIKNTLFSICLGFSFFVGLFQKKLHYGLHPGLGSSFHLRLPDRQAPAEHWQPWFRAPPPTPSPVCMVCAHVFRCIHASVQKYMQHVWRSKADIKYLSFMKLGSLAWTQSLPIWLV